MPFREALEHMIAVTYGVAYDAVVTHFPPYEALLDACGRARKPGGHALFLTYERPAGLTTFHEVRAAEGLGAAVRALRWLLPTMTFEFFRESEHRYLSVAEFHETLGRAGFEVL